MCGISCCYKCKENTQINKRLLNRGPDHQSSTKLGDDVTLTACVLHIQGNCKQPLSENLKHLIYNGQLFHYPQVWYRGVSTTEHAFHCACVGFQMLTMKNNTWGVNSSRYVCVQPLFLLLDADFRPLINCYKT